MSLNRILGKNEIWKDLNKILDKRDWLINELNKVLKPKHDKKLKQEIRQRRLINQVTLNKILDKTKILKKT